MSNLTTLKQTLQQRFEQFSNAHWSADYAQQLRERFAQQPLPSTQHEHWKYYAFDQLLPKSFNIESFNLVTQETPSAALSSALSPPTQQELILVDMIQATVHGDVPKGLNINFASNANQALLAQQRQQLNQTLLQRVDHDASVLIANLALSFTVEIIVDANTQVTSPVVLLLPNLQSQQLCSCQVVVQVNQGASLTLLEKQASGSSGSLLATSVLAQVADNSECYHYTLGNQVKSSQLWHGLINVQQHARYHSVSLMQTQQAYRRHQVVQLLGAAAQVSMKTAYQANHQQIVDSRTELHHLAPHCNSQQVHLGLLSDQALGGFNGLIHVDPEALKTDGQMDNRVLLFDQAQNNSKPQLEIYADDVKCSHGFTCGRMNEQQLFYLQSRGIPRELAKQHLINAFLSEVTDDLPAFSRSIL